jgi:predicted Zn-dependent protease
MARGGAGLIVALLIAVFSLFRYFGSSTPNPVTGEKQHVSGITPQQEIALGLQAAPQMAAQYGGESDDPRARALVQQIGEKIVAQSDAAKTPYRYQFHVLADPQTVNAFALPGGQVFITEGLLRRLKSPGEVAGVLGHEVGHVVARHSAEHLAKTQLTQGLTGAAVLATYDPNDPRSGRNAAVIAAVGQLVNLKFGRDDELEADKLGVRLMSEAGYDPRSMIEVMKTLAAAGGGRSTPEFFSTHPNPQNRIPRIQESIKATFPNGVPAGLER